MHSGGSPELSSQMELVTEGTQICSQSQSDVIASLPSPLGSNTPLTDSNNTVHCVMCPQTTDQPDNTAIALPTVTDILLELQ